MKIRVVQLLIFTLLVSPLFAQDGNRIAVLDFNTSGVSESEMQLFTDYIATRISDNGGYILIDRRQRDNILSELSFSNSGCTDEECQLEIGRLLSANVIVVGSLGSIGSVYLLNMHLVEVQTSETLKTVSQQYDSLELLVKDSENLVAVLLGSQGGYVSSVTEGDFGTEENEDPQSEAAENYPSAGTSGFSGDILLKKRTFWRGVHYAEGSVNHYMKDFDALGERIVNRINTPSAEELLQEYAAELKKSNALRWGGLACAAAGVLLAMEGLNNPPVDSYGYETDEPSPLAIAGLAAEVGGLVLVIISGTSANRAVGYFDELIALYNHSLK